jgi:hypothetical protein
MNNKANLFGLVLLGLGIFLIWAGIKNQNPIMVLKAILTGSKPGTDTTLGGGTQNLPNSAGTYAPPGGKSQPFQPVQPQQPSLNKGTNPFQL